MERQYLRKKYVKTNKEKNASNILDACVCQGEAACQGVGRARGEGVARGGASSGPSVGGIVRAGHEAAGAGGRGSTTLRRHKNTCHSTERGRRGAAGARAGGAGKRASGFAAPCRPRSVARDRRGAQGRDWMTRRNTCQREGSPRGGVGGRQTSPLCAGQAGIKPCKPQNSVKQREL